MSSSRVRNPESGGASSRRHNQQRLLDAIRQHGPISRADLAKCTRLSPPTVSSLIEGLLGDTGLLREVGVGISSGGRPPILLAFNAGYGCLVGLDITSRALRFSLTDLQGRAIGRAQVPLRTDSRAAGLDQVVSGIGMLLQDHGRDPASVFAIGISAPGTTDIRTGRVASAPNLPGWVDVPLRDLVQARYKVPVAVDNDANMAALGEQWQGSARSAEDFVFLSLGAGLGAGVVIGGRLHHGHRFCAGEISRMMLDYREWDADHGQRGYLGARIGAASIPNWAQARPLVAAAGSDSEAALRVIFDLARSGDTEASAVLDNISVFLGSAVANIVSVLDPQLVVFGGGLSRAGELLIDRVRRVVTRLVPNVPGLELSGLGEEAALTGSVRAARQLADVRVLEIAGGAAPMAARGVRAESR
jgi:glucokinase